MANYWLFKSEPDVWSWDQQKAKGEAGEEWTGVRNYQARNNMRMMKLGDKGFFYHSNEAGRSSASSRSASSCTRIRRRKKTRGNASTSAAWLTCRGP